MNVSATEGVVLKIYTAAVGFKTRCRGCVTLNGVNLASVAVKHKTDVTYTATAIEENEVARFRRVCAARLCVTESVKLLVPLLTAYFTPNVVFVTCVASTPVVYALMSSCAALEKTPRNKRSAPRIVRAAISLTEVTHVVVVFCIVRRARGQAVKRAV